MEALKASVLYIYIDNKWTSYSNRVYLHGYCSSCRDIHIFT